MHNNVCVIMMFSNFLLVVFMGSKKYPDENAFDVFIKKHGGSDNASTDCERVSYKSDNVPDLYAGLDESRVLIVL